MRVACQQQSPAARIEDRDREVAVQPLGESVVKGFVHRQHEARIAERGVERRAR